MTAEKATRRIKKQKIKKPRVSRAQIMTVDSKYVGNEPLITGDVLNTDPRYREALNWYNYSCDLEQGKDWLLEYLKNAGYPKHVISNIRRAPKHATSTTSCWQARMMLNGTKLDHSSMEFFNSRVASNSEVGAMVSEPSAKSEGPNIQNRIQNKVSELMAEVESEIDRVMVTGESFNLYEFLIANQASSQATNAIREYYAAVADDVNKDDAGNREGYGKKLAFWRKVYNTMVEDCDRHLNNKKVAKVRSPRKPKTKNAVDLTKKVKFQKEDPSLKAVSVHPSEIVGASTVWTFNTKYNFICVYHASGPSGITIRGTTLDGFDVERSKQKSARKPAELINQLMSAGKVSLRTFIDNVKTKERVPTGRLNEDTLILKVIKNG